MVLVNVKQSGTQTSGVITHVDPRGGAAITGENGVGKTTTLQLFPLFFGFAPSQVFQVSGNKQPMLRFVLPHPQCAIIYEYERGPTDDDVHCAVIRRQATSDAPEYRFIEGPFRQEYFTEEPPGAPGPVFLDDDGMVAAVTRLGGQVSAKLQASSYRSAILNLHSVNKDSDQVRKLAARYSFSHKRLPLLDRLVASVVKEHVDFRDLTAVIVTIVFDQMGGFVGGAPGSQKLQMKQGREQIDRWLRNRDACERAQKAQPDVEALRALLQQNRVIELRLGEVRGDAKKLATLLNQRLTELNDELTAMDAARSEREAQEATEKQALDGQLEQATKDEAAAKRAYEDQRNRKLYFDDEAAEEWSRKVNSKPALQAEHIQAATQALQIEGVAQGIARAFDDEIANIRSDAQKAKDRLLQGKGVFAQRYQEEVDKLNDQEAQNLTELAEQHQTQAEALQDEATSLSERVGAARAAVQHPEAGTGLVKRLEEARSASAEHAEQLLETQTAYADARAAMAQANAAFSQREGVVSDRITELAQAQKTLQETERLLKPQAGTLLAALTASPDDAWKSTIARVIDPALLQRSDLHPAFHPDTSAGVYGWGLDLNAIANPQWTNDSVLRAQIQDCAAAVVQCQAALDTARAELQQASSAYALAKEVHDRAEAQANLTQAKTAGIKLALTSCEKACEQSKAEAGERARIDLARLEAAVKESRTRMKDLERRQQRERDAVQQEFRTAREQALNRRTAEERRIDTEVAQFQARTEERCKEIEAQKARDLQGAGVDVGKLRAQRELRDRLAEQLREIAEKEPMVTAWANWMQAGGPGLVVDLKATALRRADALDDAQKRHSEHVARAASAATKFSTARRNLVSTIEKTGEEVVALVKLVDALEEYTPAPGSRVTLDTTAAALKGLAQGHIDDLDKKHRDIDQKYRKLETSLIGQDSAVKDFIVRSLDDLGVGAKVIQKAERLCAAHHHIGREVLQHVNTELNTILQSIGQFRGRIQTFESEVRAFNRRLQDGLNGVVSGFARIQDMHIDVVTDFEHLDFMGKLAALDEVVRVHREQHRATYSIEVPPQKSAYALRDFMSVLGSGSIEIDLSQHITLSGSINDNGNIKPFKRESELEHVSSNGLTAIVLITLLSGLLNVIRGSEEIWLPWVTDEVEKFDPKNFKHLMQMLRDNRIDVITASPSLTPAAYAHFVTRYRFGMRGSISIFNPQRRRIGATAARPVQEVGAA